jgi:catechol 2,3-dioxygenase-like lactoylglutathione lyase family enzyme
MSRVKLALRGGDLWLGRLQDKPSKPDLEGSVAFYSQLFGAELAERRHGYANFAIIEPPLKLVLIESRPGEHPDGPPRRRGGTTEEVTAATAGLAAEGRTTATEENTACCTSTSPKPSRLIGHS